MFIVTEFQVNAEGNLGNITTTYTDQLQAESKFYDILHSAAISSVPIHTAMVLTSEGEVLMSKCYQHTIPVETEPPTESEVEE